MAGAAGNVVGGEVVRCNRMANLCSNGCKKTVHAHGLCHNCYRRKNFVGKCPVCGGRKRRGSAFCRECRYKRKGVPYGTIGLHGGKPYIKTNAISNNGWMKLERFKATVIEGRKLHTKEIVQASSSAHGCVIKDGRSRVQQCVNPACGKTFTIEPHKLALKKYCDECVSARVWLIGNANAVGNNGSRGRRKGVNIDTAIDNNVDTIDGMRSRGFSYKDIAVRFGITEKCAIVTHKFYMKGKSN